MKHKHHIIPKYAGGTDDEDNLVYLTIEEHANEHKKLYEKYDRWQDKVAWYGLAKMISKEELIRMKLSEAGRAGALKANKNRDYPIEYIPSRKGEYDKTLCEDKKAY